jgi:hypothetical protein
MERLLHLGRVPSSKCSTFFKMRPRFRPVPWANTSKSVIGGSISFGPTIPDVDQQLCCDLGRRWRTGGPRANPVSRGGADVVAVGFSRGRSPTGAPRRRSKTKGAVQAAVIFVGCSRSAKTCDVRALSISQRPTENGLRYSDASSQFMVTGRGLIIREHETG